MLRRILALAVASSALSLAACGDDAADDPAGGEDVGVDTADDTAGGSDAGLDAADDTTADAGPEPTVPDLPEGWTVIEPGGDTVCSRGTPYRFAVRRGTVNRVVVDYMGGGACWDATTCGFAGAIFNEDTEGLEDLFAPGQTGSGIYDDTNPENPFADWWHVFIPYCTGDIHWGDAQTTYGEGAGAVTIEHRGAVNGAAVLDWITENFSAPEQLFVTGCSAGAYGSIGWAPRILDRFPDAAITQLGDSGVGIITDQFFEDSFPSWNATEILPEWIETLNPDVVDIFALELSDIYIRIAEFYPDIVFSQFTTAYDDNQTFYFEAMGGGDVFDWSEQMYTMIERAVDASPNFASYIAPGERHCILPYDAFYDVEADGVRLVDWVNDLVAGENPGHVRCVDCEAPEQ